MGELRWWPAVRSYPHPESKAENSAVDVSKAVSKGSEQMLVTEGLGGGMVVVVEESSHEQAAAIFSSSLSQTTGPPIVCCVWHVWMSRASKQVKYGILAMSLRHILCRRGHAWPFTVSSRLPNAQSHVANHQRKPHQSTPVPDVCAHSRLPRASHVLLALSPNPVTRDHYYQHSNTTACTSTR